MPNTVRGRDLSTRKAPSSRSDERHRAQRHREAAARSWPGGLAGPGAGPARSPGPRAVGRRDRSGRTGCRAAAQPPASGRPARPGGGSTADRLSPWTSSEPASYGDAFADVYDRWYADVTDAVACVAPACADLAGERPPAAARSSSWAWAPVASRCRWSAQGLAVTGVDASAAMLDALAAKPGAERLRIVRRHGAT